MSFVTRKRILATGATLALASAGFAAPKKPNIIMIYADDMGYGDLSCYGNKNYKTPNLDKMAAEGVRLTQFYVSSPACSPSRASLITGKYPVEVGIPKVLHPYSLTGLRPGTNTIEGLLKSGGYATGCIGKWNLGHLPRFLPFQHDFDYYFGIPYSNDMVPTPLMRDNKIIEEPVNQDTLTQRYTDEALRFIDRSTSSGKPFFLYFPHTFPHVPLHVSARFRGKSGFDLYGDVITELDWSVGEILKHLHETKLDKNTLVIFSSDNGPWLIKKKNGGSAGPLRDGKGTCFEGGIREPFIAWWPGVLQSRVIDIPAINMDMLPTFCRLASVTLPKDKWDGQDIWPLLKDGTGKENRTFFFPDYYVGNSVGAIRDGKWKIVFGRKKKGKYAARKTMLFNLDNDTGEKHDLAAEHPDIIKRLTALAAKKRRQFKQDNPWAQLKVKRSPEAVRYATRGTTESQYTESFPAKNR